MRTASNLLEITSTYLKIGAYLYLALKVQIADIPVLEHMSGCPGCQAVWCVLHGGDQVRVRCTSAK